MKNRKLIITTLIVFLTQGLSWGIWINQPEMKIKLVDKETKEPIKGAFIINGYLCYRVCFPEAFSVVYEYKLYRTDDKGEIVIPDYFRITSPLDIFDSQHVSIYSTSYLKVSVTINKNLRPLDVWEDYALKGKEAGKSIYVWKKDEKHRLIIDEKNKVAIHENLSEDSAGVTVRLREPMAYLEIPMSAIKDDEMYYKSLENLFFRPRNDKEEDVKSIYDELAKYVIKDFKEFLKRYPNSIYKYDVLKKIAQIYEDELNDKETAIKYRNKAIEEARKDGKKYYSF